MLSLSHDSVSWLEQTAAEAHCSVDDFASRLLNLLSNPDSIEDDIVDRLLADATKYFPPVVTLEEQTEMREEVIDYLCTRLVEVNANANAKEMAISTDELTSIRDKLIERSRNAWGAKQLKSYRKTSPIQLARHPFGTTLD